MDSETASQILNIRLDDKMGLDIDELPIVGTKRPRDDTRYWARRKNDRIYLMTILFANYFCRRKKSVADVGCHSSPLVLMLPDFDKRFAIDPSPEAPYIWEGVDGAVHINDFLENIDIHSVTGDSLFDLIICNQVIEHIPDAASFASMLLSKCRRLIISTTFETPEGHISGHVQDPIDLAKFESWFPRKMLTYIVTRGQVGGKILAVF